MCKWCQNDVIDGVVYAVSVGVGGGGQNEQTTHRLVHILLQIFSVSSLH